MNATALPRDRDPLLPRRPQGMGKGLALAILAHLLLLLAIAFGVNWRAHEPAGIEAELWAAVPQAAAPRAATPETTPPQPTPQVTPPPPAPKAETPPPKPAPDPQIAIEKAKREEEKKKAEAKRLQDEEQAKREKAKREQQQQQQQAELEKQQRAKEEQERKKQAAADAAKQAAARDAQLKRMMAGLPDATGADNSTGTALKSSGPSASYAGRIMARIKPNIVFTDIVDGNPTATVEVKLAPDGTIVGKRLLQSSGVKAWDDAVLRAIERTEVLPRDVDGRVPP
ncbi:MAG TPA: cell envelope integrity protein TolA, partial [Burkholderiaceae bacterium]|nr:cell envelope integrity protein TolA [Burkholderiaceae bacterium]